MQLLERVKNTLRYKLTLEMWKGFKKNKRFNIWIKKKKYYEEKNEIYVPGPSPSSNDWDRFHNMQKRSPSHNNPKQPVKNTKNNDIL